MSWSSQKKKGFFLPLFLPEGNAFNILFVLNVQCLKYALKTYILLHMKKHYFIHFLLFLKNCRKPSVYPSTNSEYINESKMHVLLKKATLIGSWILFQL